MHALEVDLTQFSFLHIAHSPKWQACNEYFSPSYIVWVLVYIRSHETLFLVFLEIRGC